MVFLKGFFLTSETVIVQFGVKADWRSTPILGSIWSTWTCAQHTRLGASKRTITESMTTGYVIHVSILKSKVNRGVKVSEKENKKTK